MRTVLYTYDIFTFDDYRIAQCERENGHEVTVQVVEISTPDTPELARHRRLVAEKFGIED